MPPALPKLPMWRATPCQDVALHNFEADGLASSLPQVWYYILNVSHKGFVVFGLTPGSYGVGGAEPHIVWVWLVGHWLTLYRQASALR